ncbi:ankyrin repeat domain-containing protein [Wolbachia endosymbiont of Nilaparvata lugens]|uniref:ankyrin repeat domain-containing protein n=1 Tax=Wolbachia endosymbiont of Nilaparvata lugens TaxID=357143 RepID=UPI0011800B0E|nr:ankyrin repeat domain-containing protein [Wolbachia endosymbiont of Nilaparvata lugens]
MNEREQVELNKLLINSSQGVNIQQITELIEAGADVNAVTSAEEETPLHVAVRCDNGKLVELLLKKGAIVNAIDNLGMTPLHFALKYDNEKLVELLLEKGANISSVDMRGQTSLHIAVHYGREELVKLLLKKGANVNAVDNKGMTPLSIVASDTYCDKPTLIRTIIAYAVLHSGITTKPECIVNNSELSEFWDSYKKRMEDVKLSNSTISLYQFLRETDENKLAGYLSDREYDEIRCSDALEYISEFPEHADTIVSQFDKASDRRDLLDKSKAAIPSQNLDNPSAEQLQAAAQAHN